MDYFSKAVHDNSPTAFLRHVFIPVFCVHVFLGEVAVLIFEALIVKGDQLTKDLAFNLLDEIIDSITINEAAFLRIMSMKVEVEGESALFVEMGS